jgi:hypothetical protein
LIAKREKGFIRRQKMKNMGFFAGIFSILLIFGLLVAGCGDGGDSGNNPILYT